MRTNIEIDDKLMKEAMKAAGVKTKREAVAKALELMVRQKKQMSFAKWKGKVDWQGDLDAWRRD